MFLSISPLINVLFSLVLAVKEPELPKVIVVSFDGFRYDYLEKAPTPNFKRLAESGVRAKWMNAVYVTKTFPNHFSIATGLYEENHGIVGNEMFDPVFKEIFYLNNTETKWWDNGFSIPIWIANQMAGHHSGAVMWPGSGVKIHDRTIDHLQPYNTSINWTSRIDIGLNFMTQSENPANLLMLYFEEPDVTGHHYGPDSKEIVQKIIEIDNLVGYLIKQLETKSLMTKVHLIILSDHGMATITEERVIDLDDVLNSSCYHHYGHSPIWNILPVPGQEKYVYDSLLEGSKTFHYTLYKKEDIPDKYHYKHNRRVLNYLIEADEGYDFTIGNKFPPMSKQWGDHGYNPEILSMKPIFLATGPAFKKNYTAEPFQNLDVFPLLCHLLNIPEPPNNGSMEHVEPILIPHGLFEAIFSRSWIIACATIMCVFLAVGLTGAAMSVACGKQPPTVAFVMLRNQHIVGDKEMSTHEEKAQLLDDTD